jgi:cellulose synthase/poly-beta-1,6-N-acetylglucosamine synthase-like glycosyltransferase
MVVVLQLYVAGIVFILLAYTMRHWLFTYCRVAGTQRPFYQDIYDTRPPPLTVIIPMHNEEKVASRVLDALLRCDYPRELLEIIPIDDHSSDGTQAILEKYAASYSFIRPLIRRDEARGKAHGLNDALALATHDVTLIFDADYEPGANLLRDLAMAFIDPQVGAVMGRVIPRNTGAGFLSRMLSLERSGGYQVDQQARFNLDLMVQYGGTVGGFRRSLILEMGGFHPAILAEDTDLTYRLYARGWRVAYANHAECYEEVPETWDVRFKQLRRWARGHNAAMFRHFIPLMRSPYINLTQKIDGIMLLGCYAIPPLLVVAWLANLLLILSAAVPLIESLAISLFVVAYGAFGNFAPVFEVGAAELLDGTGDRLLLLPLMFVLFLFNSWAISMGALDAIGDLVRGRMPTWDKTLRTADAKPA